LREYSDHILEDGMAKNVGTAVGNVVQGVKNTASAAYDSIKNTASGAYDSIKDAVSDFGKGYDSATNQPEPEKTQTVNFDWNDKAAIKAFQSTHKQLDGKPLVVDGLIGPQTLQALATAGIQPPPGFKRVDKKAARVAPRVQQQTTGPEDNEIADLNKRIAAHQQWFAQHRAVPPPQLYHSQEQLDKWFPLNNWSSTHQSDLNEPIKETVTFNQEATLARIIELAKR